MPRNLKSAQSFRVDERGNVAIIFALTSFIAIGVVGGAVDFGRVYSMKYEMQATLDAAALAGGRKYAESTDLSAARGVVEAFFQERYGKNAGAKKSVPTLSFPSSDALITAQAKVDVPTPFLSFVTGDSVPLTVESNVSLGGKKLEIALMFDVTGSMEETTSTGNTKLVDAKAAAKDLIGIVLPDSGAYDARMSLIPFSQRVKLSADNMASVTGKAKTSTSTSTTTTTTTEYSLSTTDYSWVSYDNCVSKLRDDYYRKMGQSYSTAETNAEAYCDATATKKSGKNTTYKRPDIVATNHSTTQSVTSTTYINPCVIERSTSTSSRKYKDDAPATNEWAASYSKTAKTEDVSCPPNGSGGKGTLIPLTASASTLNSAVDNLQSGGGTAGHIGTAWAWYTISPKWSSIWGSASTPAEYDDTSTMKVAVLMTDGEYNNCNGSTSCTTSSTQALEFCTNMKAQGITVYTIGFGMSTDTTDPARQTLVSCASPNKYYFPYNGDELRAAFSDIGAALVSGGAGPRLVPGSTPAP